MPNAISDESLAEFSAILDQTALTRAEREALLEVFTRSTGEEKIQALEEFTADEQIQGEPQRCALVMPITRNRWRLLGSAKDVIRGTIYRLKLRKTVLVRNLLKSFVNPFTTHETSGTKLRVRNRSLGFFLFSSTDHTCILFE
jgi:hypothetical protein